MPIISRNRANRRQMKREKKKKNYKSRLLSYMTNMWFNSTSIGRGDLSKPRFAWIFTASCK